MARRIQIILLIFLVLAGIRVLLIYHERNKPAQQQQPSAPNWNFSTDDYVVPRKLHAYDLKSARKLLSGTTVWVRAGNRINYYRFFNGKVDGRRPEALLPPLAKLNITNVAEQRLPNSPGMEIAKGVHIHEQQTMAVFKMAGSSELYAAPIGVDRGGDYTFYTDDIFFLDDPHNLYKHWTAETWAAIEHHQVLQGMNELQASFALGVPALVDGGDYGNRSLEYNDGGRSFRVTFEHNKVTHTEQASSR